MSPTLRKYDKALRWLYGVSVDDVRSPDKSRHLVPAREHLCFLLVVVEGWSLPKAGHHVKRHHTTTLHNARKFSRKAYGVSRKAGLIEMQIAAGMGQSRKYTQSPEALAA